MRKKKLFNLVSGVAALLLVLASVAWVVTPDQFTSAQTGRGLAAANAAIGLGRGPAEEKTASDNNVVVVLPEKIDVSPALRDIEAIQPERQDEVLVRWNETALKTGVSSFNGVDVGLQTTMGPTAMPAPTVNFEGVDNVNGVLPPDTQGDIGPNHYVQWVNLAYGVWNRSGTQLSGPTNGNTLWSGFGGECETTNSGDPITLYDHLADRWFMSQFTYAGGAPHYQCVAVSVTSDPMGAWYRYAYAWPNSYFPDYPKFGLWPDAYYMTANQFDASVSSWRGQGVAALERDKMLLGQAAQLVYFQHVHRRFGLWWDPPARLGWDDPAARRRACTVC